MIILFSLLTVQSYTRKNTSKYKIKYLIKCSALSAYYLIFSFTQKMPKNNFLKIGIIQRICLFNNLKKLAVFYFEKFKISFVISAAKTTLKMRSQLNSLYSFQIEKQEYICHSSSGRVIRPEGTVVNQAFFMRGYLKLHQ